MNKMKSTLLAMTVATMVVGGAVEARGGDRGDRGWRDRGGPIAHERHHDRRHWRHRDRHYDRRHHHRRHYRPYYGHRHYRHDRYDYAPFALGLGLGWLLHDH